MKHNAQSLPTLLSGIRRSHWIHFLRIMTSAMLLMWILHQSNIGDIGGAMRSSALPPLLFVLILPIIGIFVSVLRWQALLESQGHVVDLWTVAQSYLIGGFFNNFLPSTFGGDAVRAYEATRFGTSRSGAVVSVLTDRVLGLLVLMMIALVAMMRPTPLTEKLPGLSTWAGIGIVLMITGGCIALWPPRFVRRAADHLIPRLPRKLQTLLHSFHALRQNPRILIKTVLLSCVLQLIAIMYYYFIGRALALPVPLASYFLIVPITLFLMALPISINAIGIRENAFVWFFLPFGVSNTLALAFVLISYSGTLLQAIVGGIIYMIRRS